MINDEHSDNQITTSQGLAILVNTCCEKTQLNYSKFCGHITATSLIDRNLVPVTNRWVEYEFTSHGYDHFRFLCFVTKFDTKN